MRAPALVCQPCHVLGALLGDLGQTEDRGGRLSDHPNILHLVAREMQEDRCLAGASELWHFLCRETSHRLSACPAFNLGRAWADLQPGKEGIEAWLWFCEAIEGQSAEAHVDSQQELLPAHDALGCTCQES